MVDLVTSLEHQHFPTGCQLPYVAQFLYSRLLFSFWYYIGTFHYLTRPIDCYRFFPPINIVFVFLNLAFGWLATVFKVPVQFWGFRFCHQFDA